MKEPKNARPRACPLTRGNDTSMLQSTWDRMCADSRKMAEDEMDIENRKIMYRGVCLECDGEVPAEVTFIALPANKRREEDEMGTVKTWNGTCCACEEPRKVRRSGDKTICARCDHLRAEIKLRPELVVKMIREIDPELLTQSGGQPHSLELEAVRQRLQPHMDEDLVGAADRLLASLAELDKKYMALSTALSNAETELDDLRRKFEALPVLKSSDIERLEDLQSEVENLHLENDTLSLRLQNRPSLQDLELSDIDRMALKDLALRLAIGVMKGEIEGIDHADVELLRSC